MDMSRGHDKATCGGRTRPRRADAAAEGGRKAVGDPEALTQAAECLKLLAHPVRLRFVQLLLHGRYSVGELAEDSGVPNKVASEQLRLMQRCGVFTGERQGRKVHCQVAEPHLAKIVGCIESRLLSGPWSVPFANIRRDVAIRRGEDMSDCPSVSVERLAQLGRRGPVEVIDVRTPAEFRELHAAYARNVPLETLDPEAVADGRDGAAGEPIYVLCRTGSRAAQACAKFLAAGRREVVHVEGGTLAWAEAGLPVVRGRKAVSLERQVRIAAGFLVLLGAVLAVAVHPYWAGLSAFVGGGLVFAGVTDTCGMGMMLARMPWNQVKPEPAATCSR